MLPHVPDAWIDESKTKVGYEIPLNRHFYRYEPPRPLDVIEKDIKQLEKELTEKTRRLDLGSETQWIELKEFITNMSENGVVAVTVCECKEHDLCVKHDPEPFPEHVVIKFIGYSKSQIERKAKRLKEAAERCGWQYKADE